MQTVARSVTVGTTPTLIFRWKNGLLGNISIRPAADMTLIPAGGASGVGLPMSANEVVGYNFRDFPINRRNFDDIIELYGIVAADTTTVGVFGWIREDNDREEVR